MEQLNEFKLVNYLLYFVRFIPLFADIWF